MIHILVNLRFWSLEALLESKGLERVLRNGETVDLIPEGLRLRTGRLLLCKDIVRCTYFMPALLIRTALCWMLETQDVANFLTRETCGNPAAKTRHLTRRVLFFHRLEYCCRACPVAGVVVKVQTAS